MKNTILSGLGIGLLFGISVIMFSAGTVYYGAIVLTIAIVWGFFTGVKVFKDS